MAQLRFRIWKTMVVYVVSNFLGRGMIPTTSCTRLVPYQLLCSGTEIMGRVFTVSFLDMPFLVEVVIEWWNLFLLEDSFGSRSPCARDTIIFQDLKDSKKWSSKKYQDSTPINNYPQYWKMPNSFKHSLNSLGFTYVSRSFKTFQDLRD